MNYASARFSPRLRRDRAIRQLTWQGDLDYNTNAATGVLEDRALSGQFGIEFNSSDIVRITATRQYRAPAVRLHHRPRRRRASRRLLV